VNADGNGSVANSETTAWVNFLKTNNISNLNWSITDKNEGSAALVPGASTSGGWVNSQLTTSGALAKDIIRNWPSAGGSGITPPSGFVRLNIKHSNKCVDVAGFSTANGGNIQQWDCGNGANQKFQFVSQGGGWYTIKGQQSNRCINVAGVSTANGANVIQWTCGNFQNEHFKLSDKGGGWFTLTARHSNKCVDVAGVSTANGANIHQWACHNGDNQQFRFN
jgi:Ricin-type beta-trefoil lectin domain-like